MLKCCPLYNFTNIQLYRRVLELELGEFYKPVKILKNPALKSSTVMVVNIQIGEYATPELGLDISWILQPCHLEPVVNQVRS